MRIGPIMLKAVRGKSNSQGTFGLVGAVLR